MRKAGLLGRQPLMATRKMVEMAANDRGEVKRAEFAFGKGREYIQYGSRYYFRAAPSALEGILEVDLFTRKDLAEGKKEPRFRIFLDYGKKDFESWDTVNGKWSHAKIDMLDTGDERYTYSYRGRNYAAGAALKLVNGYLGTGNMQDVETAVLGFQLQVRESELKGRRRIVTDMIDAAMDTVPDRLPADWMGFLNRRALAGGHCILYDGRKRTGWCTCCRLHVRVPETVRHNMAGKCTCGSRITYKSWKKQKRIIYDARASIIQKCTDGRIFVYRQFHVRMKAEREKEYVPEITVHEEYRQLFEIPDGKGPLHGRGGYEWGKFRNTGVERWCREGTVKIGCGYAYYGSARSTLYTPNLKKLFKGTKLQYVPAADIIKSTDKGLHVFAVLGDMGMSFPYEAFWKMGLERFVHERMERDGTEGLTRTETDARKPWQYLKMTKEAMKQAARLNATDRQLRIIQRMTETGARLADEQVLWLDENVGVREIMQYFAIHTPHRIIRYMKENVMPQGDGSDAGKERLGLWEDYLDAARQMHWDLRDRAVFFPQDIRRAHDEAAVLLAIRKDREEAAEMKGKDLMMHGYAKEIKKAFCYRDGEYMIKVPGCWLDFKKEGQAQHHCVATYYEKVLEAKCIILFIRRRSEPWKPFCTVEIRNDGGKFRIMQNRTAYNQDAPQDAREFMEKAVKIAQEITDRMLNGETGGRFRTAV